MTHLEGNGLPQSALMMLLRVTCSYLAGAVALATFGVEFYAYGLPAAARRVMGQLNQLTGGAVGTHDRFVVSFVSKMFTGPPLKNNIAATCVAVLLRG